MVAGVRSQAPDRTHRACPEAPSVPCWQLLGRLGSLCRRLLSNGSIRDQTSWWPPQYDECDVSWSLSPKQEQHQHRSIAALLKDPWATVAITGTSRTTATSSQTLAAAAVYTPSVHLTRIWASASAISTDAVVHMLRPPGRGPCYLPAGSAQMTHCCNSQAAPMGPLQWQISLAQIGKAPRPMCKAMAA